MSIPFIKGTTTFKTELSIEEAGELISQKLFGGLELSGLDNQIYDEVPAIYIEHEIMGLRVVLSGYSGFSEGKHFVLHIAPFGFSRKFGQNEIQEIHLNEYLKRLLEHYFKEDERFKLNV